MKRLLLSMAITLLASSVQAAQPDVIVLFADDIGPTGLSRVHTPNIDRIGQQGTTLSTAYGGPLCIPSRMTLLTGRYAKEFGVFGNLPRMPRSVPTIADRLRGAGYRTAALGKWAVGGSPLDAGFDSFLGYETNLETPYIGNKIDRPFFRDRRRTSLDGYVTDVLAAEAVRLLKQDGPPLFLYLAWTAAHEPYPQQFGGTKAQKFARIVADMDAAVGRVLSAAKPGTLVIFAADNGQGPGRNRPFRNGKKSLYDGGIRVPMAINRQVPAGSVASVLDIAPTIMDALNLPQNGLAGNSLLDGVPRGRCLTWDAVDHSGKWAIRCGDWKLVDGELYNLENDKGERHNLARSQPAMVRELKAERAAIARQW